ncbi:MAG: hypothetical protein PHV25_02615 [Candidatus Pacebacteria bacterium]|nr:hypothetical protein [Candidatus Paceibacterota bacterium]
MNNYIVSDSALKMIIDESPLSDDQKSQLAENIESLDNSQRARLLVLIRDIFAVEEEKKGGLEEVARFSN